MTQRDASTADTVGLPPKAPPTRRESVRPVSTIGVVISTVGRWDKIATLFDDLANQTLLPHTVAVAYEDSEGAADGLDGVLRTSARRLTIRAVPKSGGGAVGCNKAAALLPREAEWILFLNDTSRVERDLFERLSRYCVSRTTVCAWHLVDAEGNRNHLPARGSAFTRLNVWQAVVPAMAVRHRDYLRVGGFDEMLGTGANSPWQSGDETDLLLRLSMLDDFAIDWIDDITSRSHTDFSHLAPDERQRKLRNYGRGHGFVYRRWNYSSWQKLRLLGGAASLPIRNTKYRTADALALLIGRCEGLAGRKFSRNTDHRAVLR